MKRRKDAVRCPKGKKKRKSREQGKLKRKERNGKMKGKRAGR